MIAFTIVASILLFQAQAAPVPKTTIEGTVVQASSGMPLIGVHVILSRSAVPNGPGAPASLPVAPTSPPPPPPPPLTPPAGNPAGLGAGASTFIIQSVNPAGGPVNSGGLPSATTDKDGHYVLKEVDAGVYRVTFASNGYVKQDFGQRSMNGQGASLTVTAGKPVKDINMALTQTGNISGRIRDSAGIPAAGVPVQLIRATYNAAGLKSFQAVESINTDDRGEFRLFWLTPGRYYINAGTPPGPNNRPVAFGGGNISPNQVPGESFSYVFYPGVSNAAQATAIDLNSGSDMSGLDLVVSRQQQLNVRGRIIDTRTGAPPPSANINLAYQVFSGGGSFGVNNNYNASTGTFELTNVNPGSYTLSATAAEATPNVAPPDPAARARAATASIPIDLLNSDLENVVLNLAVGSPLNGRVAVEGKLPTSQSAIRIQLRASSNGVISNNVGGNAPPVPTTNPDGTFRFEAVIPGEYRVAMNGLPPEYYLKDARYNGVDVLNQPMQFVAGDTGTLDVVVSSGAVQIEGTVIDDKIQPAAGVSVVLVPDQHRDRTELYRNATTDTSGKYQLRGVPPGDYKLFAWDTMDQFAWFDVEVVKRDESMGKPVHVLESSNQSFDLKIISGH
jgi:5-hydroxyisourate hydrolase-like protein (transthyretin family)